MRKTRIILLSIILGTAWLLPASVYALDQPSYGGNNASDYQPPTGNPQNNTPANLQLNNKVLQPVPTLDQQALIQSGGLSVLTAPDKGAASTAPDTVTANKKSYVTLITFSIGGLLTLAAVAYIVTRPDSKPKMAAAELSKVEEIPKTPQSKASKKPVRQAQGKPAKKTSRKKRKAAKR